MPMNVRLGTFICVCVRWRRRRRKVACGKLASLRAPCCLNLRGCQRKLWSEESANRAWGMSPETRIIWNPKTTVGSHLRGPVLKCRPRLSVRVSFPLGSPISWAPSVRVPSCTVGHLLILDALLMLVPKSELTLPQFPQKQPSCTRGGLWWYMWVSNLQIAIRKSSDRWLGKRHTHVQATCNKKKKTACS